MRPSDNLQKALFGKSTSEAVQSETCVTCESPNLDFVSEKQKREYRISGMCRTCQEEVFGQG